MIPSEPRDCCIIASELLERLYKLYLSQVNIPNINFEINFFR